MFKSVLAPVFSKIPSCAHFLWNIGDLEALSAHSSQYTLALSVTFVGVPLSFSHNPS